MKSRNLIYLYPLFTSLLFIIQQLMKKLITLSNPIYACSSIYSISAEYDANNIQTYAGAKLALDKALAKKNWTAAIEQEGNFFRKTTSGYFGYR